jgi:hypothetical protein
MNRFEREFNKILQEDMMSADVVGGSEGLEGGSVGNGDTWNTGNQIIPSSIFGGTLTRGGITKCKKCKKGKKCKECEEAEEETK